MNFLLKLPFFIVLLSFPIKAQTYEVNYIYTYNNFLANNSYDFKSTVYLDTRNKNKLYTIFFGISDENTKNIDKNIEGVPMIPSKLKSQYLLFLEKDKTAIIKDLIEQKEYILEDKIPSIEWNLSTEIKKIGELKLNKAVATFRGREYTVWYDSRFSENISPWKFNGLKGLIYEVKDKEGQVCWKLESIVKNNTPVIDPFDESMKRNIVPYTQYPKLRYGLSERLKESLKSNPNNTIFEQERIDIEIKFEWE